MPFLAVENLVKNAAEKETLIFDRKEYYKIQGHGLLVSVTRLVLLRSVQQENLVPLPIQQRDKFCLNFQVPVIFQLYLAMFSTASSLFPRKNLLVNNALAIVYISEKRL
jgi:hypothetical protein